MITKDDQVADDIVGLGLRLPTPIRAPRERVWAAMVDKIYHTEKYLPVTDVKATDIKPGYHAYREMRLQGETLIENIYFDESRCEIRATFMDNDEIHFNVYNPDTGILEYWQENTKGERIPWRVSKAIVLKAMEATKHAAEATQ
jgi:hypothetical protein